MFSPEFLKGIALPLLVPALCVGVWMFPAQAHAQAQGGTAGIRHRAECAQVELSRAVGERVSARDSARCEGYKAPTRSPRISRGDSKRGQVPDLLKDVQPPGRAGTRKAHKSRPAWIDRLPAGKGMFYGVGQGETLMKAYQRAATVVAGQVQLYINAEHTIEESESHRRRGDDVKSSSRTHVAESSQMFVRGLVDEVKIEDQYNVPGKKMIWILASLDMAALRKKQDALVAAVFGILERAISRINARVGTTRALEQPALVELIDVLTQVKRLGRSRIGRKVRHRWTPVYDKYRRVVERLADCVHVKAVFTRGEETLDSSPCPAATAGTKVKMVFTCKKLVLAGARFKAMVSGGIVSLPKRLESNSKGHVTLNLGQVFGQGKVKVGFLHDLDDVDGAQWLRTTEPSQRGTICFKASEPARIKLKVTGLKGKPRALIMGALKALAARKWGAKIVYGSAPLNASVRIDYGNISEAMGKHAAPLMFNIVVNGREGKMFEKSSRVGSVAATPKKAREQALNNLVQAMKRW